MAKDSERMEIRITFREDQKDLYEYIKAKNSSAGFLKDLAQRELLRDENYINGKFDVSNNENGNNNNNNMIPPNYMYPPNPYMAYGYMPPNIDNNMMMQQQLQQQPQLEQSQSEKQEKNKKKRKPSVDFSDLPDDIEAFLGK